MGNKIRGIGKKSTPNCLQTHPLRKYLVYQKKKKFYQLYTQKNVLMKTIIINNHKYTLD